MEKEATTQGSIHGSEHSVFSSGQKRGRVIEIISIIRYVYSTVGIEYTPNAW